MPLQMTAAQVRSKLVEALQLDLVGPAQELGNPEEILPQSPSRCSRFIIGLPLQQG